MNSSSPQLTMEEAVEIVEQQKNFQEMSFQEAISQYDLVGAHHDPLGQNSYVILADRRPTNIVTGAWGNAPTPPQAAYGSGFPEMRRSYLSPWTAWTRDERVGDLRDKNGIRKYYDMKRADGTVRGALRVLKTPILSARWFIEPFSDPGADQPPKRRDVNIASFVQENLFSNLNVPWSRVVEEALTMCEYGYSVLEKVWEQKFTPQGEQLWLQKLKPIHPLDIREWIYDEVGEVEWLIIEGNESNNWVETPVHRSKFILFSLEPEGGDLRGISILRSAYKHYYYKDTLYKIDAIQKERHGIGVPLIKLPMGFTTEDRTLADELGRNLRTNERAHITAPINWEISFAKLEGQPVDCLLSINHHDQKIMSNVLAPFLDDPNTKADSIDMFLKSTRYIANTVADTFTKDLIPQLVDANFLYRGGAFRYPTLHARRIGEWEDMRTMSFTLRNLVGAKLITPDLNLEQQLRRELDMPTLDEETIERIKAQQEMALEAQKLGLDAMKNPELAKPADANTPREPQAPEARLPRQTKPSSTPPRDNGGRDASGG